RVGVEAHGPIGGLAVDERDDALRLEGAQARVPGLDLAQGLLAHGAQVGLGAAVEEDLEARGHRVRGEADGHRRSGQSFRACIVLGSNPNAPPSHMERVARSTMTMTLVPWTMSLSGCPRVRMHSSHLIRCMSWSLPMSGHSTRCCSTSSL